MIYGRWVIFSYCDDDPIFEKLSNVLKPSGVLTYEGASHVGEREFSYPYIEVIRHGFEGIAQLFAQNNYTLDVGSRLYHIFTHIGLTDVNLLVNQPVMTTAEEKSVMRLGYIGVKNELLKFMSEQAYDNLIQRLIEFEQSDAIAGFYHNILAAGVKPAVAKSS